MLLFDDGKKLEKAVGEEAAKTIVEVLERFDESQRSASASKGDLRETDVRLLKEIDGVRLEIQKAKAETIKWVAGIITAQTVASIAAIIALMK